MINLTLIISKFATSYSVAANFGKFASFELHNLEDQTQKHNKIIPFLLIEKSISKKNIANGCHNLDTPPSKCPGAFYPDDFPGEKIEAKSVPGQAANLPVTKRLTSETSAANRRTPERDPRNYFHVETVPRQ